MNTSRFGASLDCAALGATYPTLTKELSHSTCVKLHPDALFAFANHVPRCASHLDSVSHPAHSSAFQLCYQQEQHGSCPQCAQPIHENQRQPFLPHHLNE
jgi:hypothetical protein